MNTELFRKACEQCFELSELTLGDAYYYNSLAFCVIDAVYSIGVRYTSTQNTVCHFCEYAGLIRCKDESTYDLYTTDDLIREIEKYGSDGAADILFANHQRTSTRNGILKSEAVLRFAKALQHFDIHTFADYRRIGIPSGLEKEILTIPGQRSGLSLRYLCMLAGDDNTCKPDRHVLRFIEHFLGEKISIINAQKLLAQSVDSLKRDYPNLTVRCLDHAIWRHMSAGKPLPEISSSKRYYKLVRDRIPEIIEASGKTCTVEVLSDEDYLKMVDAKLDEELAEYHEDQNIEELADLLEVIRAAAIARGYTVEELEQVRAEKALKRGSFEKKLLLKEVRNYTEF